MGRKKRQRKGRKSEQEKEEEGKQYEVVVIKKEGSRDKKGRS